MREPGLTRVPYYPELNVLNRSPGDCRALVLSVLLYWHTLHEHERFNLRLHGRQLALKLRISPEEIDEAVRSLAGPGILSYESREFETESANPGKKLKKDEFFTLDFKALHRFLSEHGRPIPLKVLRQASSDYFDLYTYISADAVPLRQGLLGRLCGENFEKSALFAAALTTGICADDGLEDFSHQALAPGWRMLAQPPATPGDIKSRWLRDGERGIDIETGDGVIFIPDGDLLGTGEHKIWHSKNNPAARTLAAALFLGIQALCPEMSFISDLKVSEFAPAFRLLKERMGIEAELKAAYFESRDLYGEELSQEQAVYAGILNAL